MPIKPMGHVYALSSCYLTNHTNHTGTNTPDHELSGEADRYQWQPGSVYVPAGGNLWYMISDRAMKDNIRPVNGREILDKLEQVPISRWSYKGQDSSIEHIGPMAQDFYAAFGLGEDERYISTIDPDGVALAAIKGLHELLREKEAEIATQQAQMESLESRLARLEAMIAGE